MKKETKALRAFMDARELPLDLFYDFGDKTYKAARTRRDVFLMLASYAESDGTGACPSLATLARNCCLSTRQVQRVAEWLTEQGLLSVESKASRYGTNKYKIIIPGKNDVDISAIDVDISKGDVDISNEHLDIKKCRMRDVESIERVREEPQPARSKDAGQVLKEITKAGGTVSRKDVAAITVLLSGKDWTDAEIISGTRKILDKLDTFEMKQAGDRVSSNLESEISIERERAAKMAEQQEQMQVATEAGRLEVERELQELTEGIEAHL